MTIRETMEDQIRRDMLGPGSERFNGFKDDEETITVYEPWYRYSVGLLYPQRKTDTGISDTEDSGIGVSSDIEASPVEVSSDTDDVATAEDNTNVEEETIPRGLIDPEDIGSLSRAYKPSAMSLSFVVDESELENAKVTASAGVYLGRDDFNEREGTTQLDDKNAAAKFCRVYLPGFVSVTLDSLVGWRDKLDDLGIVVSETAGGTWIFFKDVPRNDNPDWRKSEWNEQLVALLLQWKTFLGPNDVIKAGELVSNLKGEADPFVKLVRVMQQSGFSSSDRLNGMSDSGRELVRNLHTLYVGMETLHLQWSRGLKRFPIFWEGQLKSILNQKVLLSNAVLKEQRLVLTARKFPISEGAGDCRVLVFVSLYNSEPYGKAHALTYAQPKITVSSPQPVFCAIQRNDCFCDKLEDKVLAMLYRNRQIFARGCGCSVEWGAKGDNGRVSKIETQLLPRRAIFQLSSDLPVDVDTEVKERALSMTYLGDVQPLDVDHSKEPHDVSLITNVDAQRRIDKLNALKGFVQSFVDWMASKEDEAHELSADYNDEIQYIVGQWSIVKDRMGNALSLLEQNDNAYRAFCLANEAVVTAIARQGKSFSSWRPFQIGFILSTLESIVNPDSADRDSVDLLWFPTGGGKTEAYLALTAFSIFYRYLTVQAPSGTTVIMRYTLKLLAMQQFSRASTLICACDRIRKRLWGNTKPRITIGLWVGSELVPNTIDDYIAKKEKHQPERCPWCGGGIQVQKNGDSVSTECKNPECIYYYRRNGAPSLPLNVVDECIYENPPTLLFGTVDKFAQLTFVKDGKAGILFGLQKGTRKNAAPSLIIQDELHLISETLGSLVGAYETVVDGLCRAHDGIRPKIIASTATVKRADDQCRLLYAREGFMQFPPPGLSVESSFFCREKTDLGREYLGIQSHGLTPADTLIRLMASILVRADHLNEYGFSPVQADYYYTLVGYFSSMRELGSCESWVRSKIQDRVGEICSYEHYDKRFLGNPQKLNSLNDNIKHTLDDMEKKKLPVKDDARPIDVLLATNMLSVGLDVDRMGLMVVAGQPKKNAEFIQASSRVGRTSPDIGLVVSFFNGKRARDRSYFEVFPDFIQSFYKYVEPTTVTPYTFSVRERLLRQIFVTLIRHLVPDRQKAPQGYSHISDTQYDEIKSLICAHVPDSFKNLVEDEIDKMVTNLKATPYSSYLISDGIEDSSRIFCDPLLQTSTGPVGFPAPAMQSLRNVDAQVPIRSLPYPSNVH